MITNQIANHIREIIMALRYEYIAVPDTICGILDSYARYKSGGPMGLGVSIPILTRRANARYYRGLDEAQALEKNEEVLRHFAYYSDMSVPVVMVGTDMQRTTGMRTAVLTRQDYSLGHMNRDDRLMLLNEFSTVYKTAAAGAQARKIGGLHGSYLTLEGDELQRAPESLNQLFDPEGEWHSIAPDELGVWDEGHVWSRDPVGNHANNTTNKYRHCPQIHTTTGQPTIRGLDRILRQYNDVVKRKKLGFMWTAGFSTLVAEILGNNLQVPSFQMGSAKWQYDIDCVNIAGTTIISDPNTPEGTLRVLEVGEPGMDDGTVFPFYWDPMSDAVDEIRQSARMLSDTMGRPKGMTFGYMRETPYFGDEWYRDTRYEDAVASKIRLASIPIVCTVRGHQLEINGLDT